MRSSWLVLVGCVFVFTVGCKSKAEECIETTDKTYEREVAACKDEACKKKAMDDKLAYYEACKDK